MTSSHTISPSWNTSGRLRAVSCCNSMKVAHLLGKVYSMFSLFEGIPRWVQCVLPRYVPMLVSEAIEVWMHSTFVLVIQCWFLALCQYVPTSCENGEWFVNGFNKNVLCIQQIRYRDIGMKLAAKWCMGSQPNRSCKI